ncbi:hypothetical protein [Paenibacillus sp. SI8]|uniref:YxiG family protein n=1 Tax=unclassified Paenibacillus TaxID=185978 RepID=UPI0034674CCD
MNSLDQAMTKLWGCQIESYDFDLIGHKFDLTVRRSAGTHNEDFKVSVEGVVSFSWINGIDARRLQLSEWEYLDLATIDMTQDTKIKILGDKFVSQFSASPNLCVEIWDSILLIEASVIKINEQKFNI